MSYDHRLKDLIDDTVDQTNHYFACLTFLASLFAQIYQPLALQQVTALEVNEVRYDLDDLLILMFEFVQLLTTFDRFDYAIDSINEYLAIHGKRLDELHQQGRLDYLHDLVQFRLRMQQQQA